MSYSGSVLGHFLSETSETSESSSGSRSQENEKDKSLHNLPPNSLVVGYGGGKKLKSRTTLGEPALTLVPW